MPQMEEDILDESSPIRGDEIKRGLYRGAAPRETFEPTPADPDASGLAATVAGMIEQLGGDFRDSVQSILDERLAPVPTIVTLRPYAVGWALGVGTVLLSLLALLAVAHVAKAFV